jgi:hypothetical protein
MKRGTYPRSAATKRKQAQAMRENARRRQHAEAVAEFFAVIESDQFDDAGKQAALVRLARRCVVTAPSGPEHVRWEHWMDVVGRGAINFGVMTAKVTKVS